MAIYWQLHFLFVIQLNQEECNGCRTHHGSQHQHVCLDPGYGRLISDRAMSMITFDLLVRNMRRFFRAVPAYTYHEGYIEALAATLVENNGTLIEQGTLSDEAKAAVVYFTQL